MITTMNAQAWRWSQRDKETYRQTDGVDRETDREADRETDRETDKQTDRQRDRQRDRLT